MTDTERAIAKFWYRLVYVDKVKSLSDVPAEYRGLVRDYFKALNEGGKK